MRELLVGIDSGTQSTKVLVVDPRDGKVLASATQEYELLPDLPPGAKEQHPHTWREAAASEGCRGGGQGHRGKRAAAWICSAGCGGRSHSTGKTVVRYRHGGGMRGDHRKTGRSEEDDQDVGQHRPGGIHGFQDTVAQKP